MIITIPLGQLVSSPRNVRRHSDPQADAELKADIEARGLLQNLVVTAVRKPKGCYAVEAGERRRRALQTLADEGKIPSDAEVACLVLHGGAAAYEASLAENFQRLSMNPADECLAFGQLIEQGADVEGIARRFGLTVRFVEGRLRLAGLAPVVFEALGAGEITLDVAKAYAASADQERQAWVYEQTGRGYASHHPESIRRMMTQASASASDRRARLVGETAYLAAGGRIEHDLFADQAAARWLDVPLLERLATEMMAELAEQARAETGLAFVRPTLEPWVSHAMLGDLRRVALEPPPLTDDERAEVEGLEAQSHGFIAVLEDEDADEPEVAEAEARLRDINIRIDALTDRAPVLDEAQKAELGTFLVLDEQGRPRLETQYYRVVAQIVEVGSEGEDGDEERAAEDRLARPNKPAGLPQRLAGELAMQRRDILALHLARDPVLALDLVAFVLADDEVGYSGGSNGSSLVARPPSDPVFGFEPGEAPASLAREQDRAGLDRSWMEYENRSERFDAFRALAPEARLAWLGQRIAGTLVASLQTGAHACAFHDHLGHLLAIDVARWWRPTGANYFDRVPKAVALEALAAIGGEAFAQRYAKHKKAELTEACERIFAGEFIAELEVKGASLAWLPAEMRFAEPVGRGEADEAAPDTDLPPWSPPPGEERGDNEEDERIGEAA